MSARRRAREARRGAILSVVTLVALSTPSALTPAGQAVRADAQVLGTCNGLTATEVGRPGVTMVGTPGDDVFITRGASRADTGAGDDSVCVTGRRRVLVNVGSGNDFVGARKHSGKSFVSLGFGDDLFFGGVGNDRVWTQEASNQTASGDRDRVYTGRGRDYVISGSSTAANVDHVELGPGDDALVTYGFSRSARLLGGRGTNYYQPLPGPGVSGEWNFDNVTGHASLNGVRRLVWVSFRRFGLQGLHGLKVRFVGSRGSERVSAGGTCKVVLRGRAGDDRLAVGPDGCHNLPAGDALLIGGPGDDQMYGASGDDVLRGGRGRDRADGGLGADRCLAEVKVSC